MKLNLDPTRADTAGQAGYRDLPSRAVVASDGNGNGCLLWWVGYCFEMEIKEAGLIQLGDLGLDDAPLGISIWEGRYVWSPGPFEHPQDGDSSPSGAFRPPDEAEWIFIMAGRAPWNAADWLHPDYALAGPPDPK